MKKLLLCFAALIICFAAGCAKTEIKRTNIDDCASIIIVPEPPKNGATFTDDATFEDYINGLKSDGKLDFDGERGDYGLFITSMDGKANEVISSTATSSEGYSWTLYIDFTSYNDVIYAGDSEVCDYNGTTLYKAVYGVSAIPCLANHTYAFVYEYYNFSW